MKKLILTTASVAGLAAVGWWLATSVTGPAVDDNRVDFYKTLDTEPAPVLSPEQALERFRVAPGFNERVIFRELFPRGLTLLDLKDVGVQKLNISNIAARQELREMMKSLKLPNVSVDF